MTFLRLHRFGLGFLLIVGVFLALYLFADSTTIRRMTGVGGIIHNTGSFYTNSGNPGIIEFGTAPTNSGVYPGASLISNNDTDSNTLSGYFWVGTIGWTSLENVDFVPTGLAAIDPYYLSGWAWSEYGGWIHFAENGTGDVQWDSNTNTFSGYVWSEGIGWISMAGATLENTSSGLIGKVKVIGQAGGNQIFDTTYSIRDVSIQGKIMNPIINAVRKNVAIIERNLPTDKMNTNFNTTIPNRYEDRIIFSYAGTSAKHVTYGENGIYNADNFNDVSDPARTLIVVGADIYIDQNVDNGGIAWNHPKAIIALQNDEGVGGNIYIGSGVAKIYSSIIAEGSLLSGYFTGTTATNPILYNASSIELLSLPNRQLYTYGSIISHNTIGGAYGQGVGNYVCPYTEMSCDRSMAIRYDFNYFRDFQKNDPNAALNRGYKNAAYDDYSFVIEYDPRVQSAPPPGLETLK